MLSWAVPLGVLIGTLIGQGLLAGKQPLRAVRRWWKRPGDHFRTCPGCGLRVPIGGRHDCYELRGYARKVRKGTDS